MASPEDMSWPRAQAVSKVSSSKTDFAAAKHGFKRAIVPKGNAPKGKIQGMEVIPVSKLAEALAALE